MPERKDTEDTIQTYETKLDVIDVPKPDSILALEKKYGKTLQPYYAKTQASREGMSEDYGPPIGYAFENESGKGVLFDTKGNFQRINERATDLFPLIGGIALSFFLPGIGAAITESLVGAGVMSAGLTADAVGLAIANTAAGVAQGQPLDKALTNAVVGAAVNTGSVEVAKEVNKFVSNKAVTDAIVSAGGSAVKTAATGGTEQDIVKNMTAALAGSAASSAYQLGGEDYTRQTGRVIGSTVAGYVTGGPTGAITGAVGEYGSQSKGKVAGAIEDVVSPQDTGALPASQVAAMTPATDAGELAPVTVTGQTTSDVTGTNIISPNAVTSTPTPTPLPPVVEQPPAPAPVAETVPPPQDKAILDLIASPATPPVEPTPTPSLEPVTVAGTKTADITDTDIINAISQEATPSPVAPVIETPLETAPVTAPPAAALEPVTVAGQKTGDITDTDIINTIAAETKPVGELQRVEIREKALPTDITKTDIIEEPAKLQDVTVTGTREEPLALEPVTITGKREEPQSLAPVTITGKRDGELEPVTITGKRDGDLDPVTITGKADEPVATPEKEPAPKEKPYKPDLFILGGKQPKAPTKPSDSVLGQALGTTTGLTASRGAGEIEDTSTGKKRKKVWNEETLRLKDALGV